MTITSTKAAFMGVIRDQVKTTAKAGGIKLSKEELGQIVRQQAIDAICGTSTKLLNQRLVQLLGE